MEPEKDLNASLPRIIVVDDDTELLGMLRRYLGEHGFHVSAFTGADQLDRMLQREPYDVLILDVMMPGEDGLSICRRLRAQNHSIPILMLTARGDPIDRIVGLEMGSDDYLAKPFDPRELIARLHAILRRQKMQLNSVTWSCDDVIKFGPFSLNISRMQLERGDHVMALSSMELQLLKVFSANAHRPMSREHLLEKVKGREHESLDRSLDVQVLRLRRKIEDDPSEPKYIRTIWGVGYMFVPDSARD
ncbi:response regulator [Pinirhizobacter sp.]|jgi:two-component system phosphate regulon response regulator OmpR|uniref:response regulator n=1 Tax=Pinirhizobacter sp. TaxID=2950432 RepID=UPI002F428302